MYVVFCTGVQVMEPNSFLRFCSVKSLPDLKGDKQKGNLAKIATFKIDIYFESGAPLLCLVLKPSWKNIC